MMFSVNFKSVIEWHTEILILTMATLESDEIHKLTDM